MFFSFGIATGAFDAISTLLNLVLEDTGSYTYAQIGIIGFLIVLSGIFGAFLAGVVADYLKKMRILIIVFYVLCFGGILLFVFVLFINVNTMWIMSLISCVMGFVLTAILPISMEATVNTTFPIAEAVSVGLILMSAQFFGVVLIVTMNVMFSVLNSWTVPNWILVGCVGVSVLLIFFFKAGDKRRVADERK